MAIPSLHCRSNLTPVGNILEVAPRQMFWVPNGLNELPEVHFELPLTLIGKSTMAFLTDQSWHILKS